MISWHLDSSTSIYPLEQRHKTEVHKLISENRIHLDRWLRWSSAIQTLDDVRRLIDQFQVKLKQGDGFHCGIWVDEVLAGAVVCWHINPENKNAEIGYWLGEVFTGRGLATRASEKSISYLFDECGLNRIEMQCGIQNEKSRAIPERLGFKLEGIRRESHWITDRFVDHAVYGILASEWSNR